MKIYYLYNHVDCKGEIFYYGMGTKNNHHSYGGFERAYSKLSRNKEWWKIANKGYTVNILETSEDKEYIREKEDELSSECVSCVNKQKNKIEHKYTIEKISETLAKISFYDKTFFINSLGELFNNKMEKKKIADNGRGYMMAHISSMGRNKNIYIHRLVAQAFISNPDNKPCVNHINCVKDDNKVENLEWITYRENLAHSFDFHKYKTKKGKSVVQFTLQGEFVREWNETCDIMNYYKCAHSLINVCANQNNKSYFAVLGYLWVYKEDFVSGNIAKFNFIIEKYKNKLYVPKKKNIPQ